MSVSKMEYRFLGRTGLKVSAISLGGWITHGGHVTDDDAFASIKAAHDAGVNFFDTAENYNAGKAEIVLGSAIKKFGWKQNDLVVSTKIYFGLNNSADPSNPINNVGLSRKHIIEGLNLSLERLGLPYVDIVYAHRPDRNTPIEEVVRAFNHLINTDKAFYWGTSEWSASEIADAWRAADRLNLIGPAVEQPQYNLLTRTKVEDDFRWLYGKFGTGLTVFSPLKQGILTGKYNGVETPPPGSRLAEATDKYTKSFAATFGNETWQRELKQVEALKPIAEEIGATLSQLALAWVLSNPNVSSLITGASRVEQVHQNIQALGFVEKLTAEVLEKIDKALGNKPVVPPLRF
ncbi:putative voltage-gated potassium channel subunit beta [Lachnellula hyalina]|uniref:Putative voltage-gated potassium channel subunit beta n=1 Tax=Lachnellula hyalina TaxID=1316788 RepID=A0A8H8R8V0_9HELO|nr:putative voltage-gated potassium channel subunit beta [Lachnellula hyalina]TVY30705.1 putative voltage-gated potassium channel subunit beta [Lachnellula hyalina]